MRPFAASPDHVDQRIGGDDVGHEPANQHRVIYNENLRFFHTPRSPGGRGIHAVTSAMTFRSATFVPDGAPLAIRQEVARQPGCERSETPRSPGARPRRVQERDGRPNFRRTTRTIGHRDRPLLRKRAPRVGFIVVVAAGAIEARTLHCTVADEHHLDRVGDVRSRGVGKKRGSAMSPVGLALRHGVAAARAQQFERARPLLEQATTEAPDDAVAWFWLAIASPSADAAIPCLRRVLAIDQSHARAREVLTNLLVTEAKAGATAGDRRQGSCPGDRSGGAVSGGAARVARARVAHQRCRRAHQHAAPRLRSGATGSDDSHAASPGAARAWCHGRDRA